MKRSFEDDSGATYGFSVGSWGALDSNEPQIRFEPEEEEVEGRKMEGFVTGSFDLADCWWNS